MATDYEKKYKEALERAKRLTSDMTTLQKIREFIFPELAESEDERIRRKMLEHFRSKTKETWCNMPVKGIIAYLEKQKEQKPGEIPPYVTGIKGEPDPAGVWKPSKEQMKALNEIVNILAASPFFHQNDYLFNILNGLREELKKLL